MDPCISRLVVALASLSFNRSVDSYFSSRIETSFPRLLDDSWISVGSNRNYDAFSILDHKQIEPDTYRHPLPSSSLTRYLKVQNAVLHTPSSRVQLHLFTLEVVLQRVLYNNWIHRNIPFSITSEKWKVNMLRMRQLEAVRFIRHFGQILLHLHEDVTAKRLML